MTAQRQAKNLALSVSLLAASLLLAAATPMSAQARPPAPATGLAQTGLAQLTGASPLTVAQISQLAAAQSQATPTAPAPSKR